MKSPSKAKGTAAVKTATDTAAAGNVPTETVAHVGDLVYDRPLLAQIAAGTDSPAASAMIPAAASTKLIELELVTFNPAGPDASGMLQVALSPRGREAYNFDISDEGKANGAAAATKRTRTKSTIATPTNFTISTVALPIPDHVRGSRGNELYPFRELAVNHSFHIPTDTAEVQEVINQRVTSSISTSQNRYLDSPHPVTNTKGARFVNRKVGADDPNGLGVRVWRVDDLSEDERLEVIEEQAAAEAKRKEEAAKKAAAAGTVEAPPAV